MSIQDPRTSERYQPRWEIWMPVFIHYAVSNVVNSLATLEVLSSSMEGIMTSQTMAAWDKLVGNVVILEAHMMDLWRKEDSDFEKAQAKFYSAVDNLEENMGPRERIAIIKAASEFYHQILQLMNRRGGLRWKPPRSFGKKHD